MYHKSWFTPEKLVLLSLLTAVALIIFTVEMLLPSLTSIPGIKLGLANIVSLFTMFWLGRKEAFCVLMTRILLGSMLTGQIMTLIYSISGGLLSFCIIALCFRFFNAKQLWIPSIISGLFHNIGQISCAIIILKAPQLVSYLPVLIISGIVTGCFTGLVAQHILAHRAFQKNKNK